MNRYEAAAAGLEDRDWSGAQIVDRSCHASLVHSVTMSRDLTERLLTEAQRRGCTPNDLIRDLVETGLSV